MCTGVITKSGKHIETVSELAEHLNIDLNGFAALGYEKDISNNSCLCCIDFDELFADERFKGKYEYEAGEWWER